MNKNIEKTIEELSLSSTSEDLWDELNQVTNPNHMLLYLEPNLEVKFRFLGPFMGIYRSYAPFKKYSLQIDIEKIIEKDRQAIKEAEEILRNIKPDSMNKNVIPAMIKFIKEDKIMWQKGTFVNVYVDGQIKVLMLNRRMGDAILDAIRHRSNTVLSGLYAPEISMTRKGQKLQTQFEVKVGQPSYLSDRKINNIMSRGLVDLPTLITELNKCKTSSYYYKKATDYKMPDVFMKELWDEKARMEENAHVNEVEEHLNDLPPEAFERRNTMREAIGSLEL